MNRDAPDLPQFDVRCLTCGAKIGQRCDREVRDDRRRHDTHLARIKLARAIGPLLTEDIKEIE